MKPFAASPSSHYCKVSNIVFDEVLPNCTLAEQSVLMFILRRTAGFNKAEDKLSYNQIGEGTGIKGRATISTALKGLLDKGIITQRGERRGSMRYGLNKDFEIETSSKSELDDTLSSSETKLDGTETSSKSELDSETPEGQLVQNLNYASSKSELDESHLVQKLNTSKDMSFKDNLKNTTTTTTTASDIFRDCLKIYQNNVGSLGPMQLQDFQAVYDGLSPPPAETVTEWFKYAALEATSNGVNNWKYFKAILENINRAGGLQAHRSNRNGQHNQSPARNSPAKTRHPSSAQPGPTGSGPRSQAGGGDSPGNEPETYLEKVRKHDQAFWDLINK